MDPRVSSSLLVGGVLARVLVGARGSWESDRRGGARSSDDGVDKRDCKSGGGGDDDEDAGRRVLTIVLVVPGPFANARISMKLGWVTSC